MNKERLLYLCKYIPNENMVKLYKDKENINVYLCSNTNTILMWFIDDLIKYNIHDKELKESLNNLLLTHELANWIIALEIIYNKLKN